MFTANHRQKLAADRTVYRKRNKTASPMLMANVAASSREGSEWCIIYPAAWKGALGSRRSYGTHPLPRELAWFEFYVLSRWASKMTPTKRWLTKKKI